MSQITLEKKIFRNQNIFNLYNGKRKELFSEVSPKESPQILYLLPWLLSVNHPDCPGYLPEMENGFKVYGIENSHEVKKKEAVFKKMFKIKERSSLYLKSNGQLSIDGIYTIGSIGSVAQTQYSDCDIWVCADYNKFGEKNWDYLVKKINLIKDWFDENCKIPVYFFTSDVNNIKKGYFGKVDKESSGSAQKNILMEEFYRTTIVIMGKTPFWWVCWSKHEKLDYEKSYKLMQTSINGCDEYVDFGDLPQIESSEFLGSSLWQLQKALASPLKSVIKMALLKRQIDDPGKRLAADLFREKILTSNQNDFLEPMTFTLGLLLKNMEDLINKERNSFLKECFFLRCNMKAFEKKKGLRKKFVDIFIKCSGIPRETQYKLSDFENWDMASQLHLGKRLVQELFNYYKEISAAGKADAGINLRDLTVLGRKIASIYQRKNHKVNLIPKPIENFNLLDVTFVYDNDTWFIYAGNDRSIPLFQGKDIVKAASFVVWNDLFKTGRIKMLPNHTSVSLQEIINLCHKLKDFFGTCDVLDNSPGYYLKKEKVKKVFVVVSFEEIHYEKNINNFAVIYKTTWGELFVRRIRSPYALQNQLKLIRQTNRDYLIDFYLQRNSNYYEKIIRRTRDLVERSLSI